VLTLGIHGFGRIGRAIHRAALEDFGLRVLAINDRCDDDSLVYLLRHDSHFGRLLHTVVQEREGWRVDGRFVHRRREGRIANVHWAELGVDLVIDASGTATRDDCLEVTASGVTAVILTRAATEADLTTVAGVNDADYNPSSHRILSTSSCDANAAALVLSALSELSILGGSMLTLHPWLAEQNLLDGPSAQSGGGPIPDLALGRAATVNLIPKHTSLVNALSHVLPRVAPTLSGMSYRVPTAAVSSLNLFLHIGETADRNRVNEVVFHNARCTDSLDVSDEALVSTDFIGASAGAVFDLRWTEVSPLTGTLRAVAWYDNESGYASQVLRVATQVGRVSGRLRPVDDQLALPRPNL